MVKPSRLEISAETAPAPAPASNPLGASQAVAALASLAHASRLAIFRLLVREAPQGACPSELVNALEIAPALLSFHLKTLLHAGLVASEQRGRSIRYRANIEHAQALTAYLLAHCCGGDATQCSPPGALSAGGEITNSKPTGCAN